MSLPTPDPENLGAHYLRRPDGAFWRWSEDGEVLAWRDGTTIAFRQEVEQVLARLAPQGFPPFGALVLLLAACRESWRGPSSATRAVLEKAAARAAEWPETSVGSAVHELFLDTLKGLDRVNSLRPELR